MTAARSVALASGRIPPMPSSIAAKFTCWLKADAITGVANGGSVATWPDSSGNSNNATQATAAKQPILVTGASPSGGPVVRANGTSQWMSTPSLAATGFTVFAVLKNQNAASVSSTAGLYRYDGTTAIGATIATDANGALRTQGWNAAAPTASMPNSTGWQLVTLVASSGTTYALGSSVLQNGTFSNGIALSAGLAANNAAFYLFTNAGQTAYAQFDIAELIFVGQTLTTAEINQVGLHLSAKHNLAWTSTYNADYSNCAITNAAGSTGVTDPDVVDCVLQGVPGGAWNGHRYWMAISNWPVGGTMAEENPLIRYSDDGLTWTLPAGAPDPLSPTPPSGNNYDPCLFYDPPSGDMYVYWLSSYDNKVHYRSSSDGVTWTTEATFTFGFVDSVSVAVDGSGTYHCYGTDSNSPPSHLLVYTAPSPTGPWTGPTTCTLNNAPSGDHFFEFNTVYTTDDGFHMFATWRNSVNTVTGIYVMHSTDGVTFNVNPIPAIGYGWTGAWDHVLVYRGCIIPDYTDYTYHCWYVGEATGTNQPWLVGKTQIPLGECPR